MSNATQNKLDLESERRLTESARKIASFYEIRLEEKTKRLVALTNLYSERCLYGDDLHWIYDCKMSRVFVGDVVCDCGDWRVDKIVARRGDRYIDTELELTSPSTGRTKTAKAFDVGLITKGEQHKKADLEKWGYQL